MVLQEAKAQDCDDAAWVEPPDEPEEHRALRLQLEEVEHQVEGAVRVQVEAPDEGEDGGAERRQGRGSLGVGRDVGEHRDQSRQPLRHLK